MSQSEELKAAVARAEKAEKELEAMKKQNEQFEQYYGLSREELVSKLKQIRELVQNDMQKMQDQEAEINASGTASYFRQSSTKKANVGGGGSAVASKSHAHIDYYSGYQPGGGGAGHATKGSNGQGWTFTPESDTGGGAGGA